MKKPLVVLAALVLLLQAGALQADDRRGHNGWRDHDRNWDRDRDHNWNRSWNRDRNHNWNRDRDHRRNKHRDRDSHFSFSINLGSRWQPGHYYSYRDYRTSGFGFDSWSSANRLRSLRHHRPVVIHQTRYVSPPVSHTTIVQRNTVHTGTSLLRDIEGRCFERRFDHAGNESRVELPTAHCDF